MSYLYYPFRMAETRCISFFWFLFNKFPQKISWICFYLAFFLFNSWFGVLFIWILFCLFISWVRVLFIWILFCLFISWVCILNLHLVTFEVPCSAKDRTHLSLCKACTEPIKLSLGFTTQEIFINMLLIFQNPN